MFWIIVLLKVPLILSHLQTFNAILHSLLQNLTILHCIHVPLHLYQLPHPIPPHTPQTIKLFPPPCLTVGVVVLSDTGSPCCFQTYTFPSDPILLIFVSSVHNTLFQSSKVQFSWYWANFRHC